MDSSNFENWEKVSNTYANWRTVKAALEAAGKTDCFYYKRAIAILSGRPDPLR
jgi:hypothetical protein